MFWALCFLDKSKPMFKLFKKKSEKDQLLEQYDKLIEESYRLSKIDRAKSDLKAAEADELMKRIEAMD